MSRFRRRDLLFGSAASFAASACGPKPTRPTQPPQPPQPQTAAPQTAELLVRGGRIETLDAARPTVEALVASQGKILALGTMAEMERHVGKATRVVDLRGGVAVPGLVDAHAHLAGLGASLEQVDLRGATSIEEVVARCKKADRGQAWILGRGWDQNLWADTKMPTHDALSKAFADRPVWLRRVDGHAGWANAAAMKAAGIGKATKAPAGGEILRDAKGNPTGVLVDAAMGLLTPPAASAADLERHLLAAQEHIVALGLTGVHDMGIGPTEHDVYRQLSADEGEARRLKVRVSAYAAQSWFATFDRKGPQRTDASISSDRYYELVGVKLYADGALGSRGAAMLTEYSDRPGHTGLLQNTREELAAMCHKAATESWQVATHAIGDAGNRTVLDEYAKALPMITGKDAKAADPRWRIEHAQIVAVEDIARFAELGVIASMQPTHATSDMAWVPARIGQARLPGAYAWRRFLDAGVALAFGSDFPVELPDVAHGLYAAITRQDATGGPEGGWLPDQRLTMHEAVAAFSRGAAHAVHREDHLGTLAVGMLADLSCFDRDLFSVEPAAVREAKATATIIAGDVVYLAP